MIFNDFCRTADFHFNKGHLADPTIPMWVVKAKGQSFYVHHVDADCPWSTRETPEASTKGSLRFKNCQLTIDENLNATISKLNGETK